MIRSHSSIPSFGEDKIVSYKEEENYFDDVNPNNECHCVEKDYRVIIIEADILRLCCKSLPEFILCHCIKLDQLLLVPVNNFT